MREIRARAHHQAAEHSQAPLEPAASRRERAREFFGQGGKLFVTNAADGSVRSLRTLVQADGDIVTRATAATIGDEELIARHEREIRAWFERLDRDWATAERWLTLGVTGVGTGAVVADSLPAFVEHAAWHPWALAPLVIAPVTRTAVAHYARRWLLRAS